MAAGISAGDLRREDNVSKESNPVSIRLQDDADRLRTGLTSPEDASLPEILDRLLDHGIIVDPYSRIRLLSETPVDHQRVSIDRDTHLE